MQERWGLHRVVKFSGSVKQDPYQRKKGGPNQGGGGISVTHEARRRPRNCIVKKEVRRKKTPPPVVGAEGKENSGLQRAYLLARGVKGE